MGKPVQNMPSIELQSSEESKQENPPWFSEVILIHSCLARDKTLAVLKQKVNVNRGRAGFFHTIDFILLLLAYAASHAPNLKAFFHQLRPIKDSLPAIWHRTKQPSQSALSRFLSDASQKPVEALRSLFLPTIWSLAHLILGGSLIEVTNTELFSTRMVHDRFCANGVLCKTSSICL